MACLSPRFAARSFKKPDWKSCWISNMPFADRNYLSFFFKTGDNVSAKEIAESSGELIYEKRQDIANSKMFDFLGGDTESWSPVNSHTISTHAMMGLPPHIAYMQVDDRRKGTIRTFIKAPYVKPTDTQPAFIESEVALNAPSLHVFISKMPK